MIRINMIDGTWYPVKFSLRAMAYLMQDDLYGENDFIEFEDADNGTMLYVRKRHIVSFCLSEYDET